MKDPCSTCDDDGVLGTSPDSPPCPECMGGDSPDPIGDEMAAWECPDEELPVSIAPPPFSHGDCYVEPGTMPCGTCFPTQRARWDADQGDPQDWEGVSAAERASLRRAVDKFRSLTEPACKPAADATSDPAIRPAKISSTGPAADGVSIPPSAAVSPRGAR